MAFPDRSDARNRALPLVLGMLIGCLATPDVVAAMFTVNSTSDVVDASPGDGVCRTAPANAVCTLRAAVMETNALAGADVINLPTGTYVLTQVGGGEDAGLLGDLDILDRLTIFGAGPATTIIDGNGAATFDRVLHTLQCIGNATPVGGSCPGGANVQAEIHGVAFRNGRASGSVAFGGGILALGNLTLENCAITSNDGRDFGGGILVQAPTTLIGTTISGNVATQGAGIRVTSAPLVVINSTISSNFAAANGGGLYASSPSTIGLFNVTITGNYANSDDLGTGTGGGVFNSAASVTLHNSIVAGNLHANEGTFLDTFDDCAGTLSSTGNNLVAFPPAGQCTINGASLSGLAPLGPLQNNGGPTLTHALPGGSAAIDAGNPGGCNDDLGATLTTDQRGEPRPFGAACDLGAFELGDAVFKDSFES